MNNSEIIESLLQNNNGYLKTADVVSSGVSKSTLGTFVKEQNLERIAHGLYMSDDAWLDPMYIIQVRYPEAIFSHETALYLHKMAEREPLPLSLTLKHGANTTGLLKEGVKVYKVKEELFEKGKIHVQTPMGNPVNVYNVERTLCDLFRYRNKVSVQELQGAVKGYVRMREKNIPLLMWYAKIFKVEKPVSQYLEVLL
jgi:predicted transcriptional regulator of viral defense system